MKSFYNLLHIRRPFVLHRISRFVYTRHAHRHSSNSIDDGNDYRARPLNFLFQYLILRFDGASSVMECAMCVWLLPRLISLKFDSGRFYWIVRFNQFISYFHFQFRAKYIVHCALVQTVFVLVWLNAYTSVYRSSWVRQNIRNCSRMVVWQHGPGQANTFLMHNQNIA